MRGGSKWSRSDNFGEALAHYGCRSKPRFRGHLLDCQLCRFQQGLRTADTRARDPVGWCRADLRAKVSAQRPDAHGRAPCDGRKREICGGILLDPREELANGRVVVDGWFMNNELRLPTGALQRHHSGSRNFRCHLGAEVASHEVKTKIEACRSPR